LIRFVNYSKDAIAEPQKSKDHRDISNSVDSSGALRVAGAATGDVSFYSVFFSLVCEAATEKIG
jgi:hypothetical protein